MVEISAIFSDDMNSDLRSKPVLLVAVDRRAQSVRFSGPGTFQAKELIKQLGPARWLGAELGWEVRPCVLSAAELTARLPGFSLSGLPLTEEPPAEEVPGALTLPSGVSVSQLLAQVSAALSSAFPAPVFVYGVLNSVKQVGERLYLELSDKARPDESTSCVIWRDAEKLCEPLAKAGFKLERDLEVMFEARVQLNPRRGQITLNVICIVAEYTIAKIAAMRELTNKRLREEGLFGRNKTLTLPFLPQRLGILTSAGGTVINDFMASLNEGRFGFELFWMSVAVQGSDAKRQIVNGLTKLAQIEGLEAILLFRGGGSPAELAVFNDYEVAKAICLCPLPVLSAIGHQEDQSSAQDVSNRAFGVPKDLGHFFAQLVIDLRRRFADFMRIAKGAMETISVRNERELLLRARSLLSLMERLTHHREETLQGISANVPVLCLSQTERTEERLSDIARPAAALASRISELSAGRLRNTLSTAWQTGAAAAARAQVSLSRIGEMTNAGLRRALERQQERLGRFDDLFNRAEGSLTRVELTLENASARVEGASPGVQLKRGFAIVRAAGSDRIITSASQLGPAESIDLQFHDASKRAKIE